MTVREWQPSESPGSISVSLELLRRFSEVDLTRPLADSLSEQDVRAGASLAGLEEENWGIVHSLDTAEIESLIRFFTLAESQLSGWEAGRKSPVIQLVKILKSDDAFSVELRKWIKKNTSNRYLPYGSAL